jgi:hypothetical protein
MLVIRPQAKAERCLAAQFRFAYDPLARAIRVSAPNREREGHRTAFDPA